jgi:hypothetical protein
VRVKDAGTGEVRTEDRLLRMGLARKVINKHVGRIRRMFAWAVEELLPAGVHAALLRVKGLRKDKGQAREKARVKPVADAWVQAAWPHLPVVVRATVEVQRLTGARPQDVVGMRPVDIDAFTTAPEKTHLRGGLTPGSEKKSKKKLPSGRLLL